MAAIVRIVSDWLENCVHCGDEVTFDHGKACSGSNLRSVDFGKNPEDDRSFLLSFAE